MKEHGMKGKRNAALSDVTMPQATCRIPLEVKALAQQQADKRGMKLGAYYREILTTSIKRRAR